MRRREYTPGLSYEPVGVIEWDSLTELLGAANPGIAPETRGGPWDGDVSPQEAHKRAVYGDSSLVARALDHMARHADMIRLDNAPTWSLDVMGSTPCVPAVIAGHPHAMRRRVARPRDSRTVRVFVSLVCSAGISADKMLARGCAILGLVEALQASGVHVELHAVAELPCSPLDVVHVVPIETPLDVSRAGFALAHPAFTRHTMYTGIGRNKNVQSERFNGGWIRYDQGQRDRQNGNKVGRAIVGASPQDVWCTMAHLNDPLITHPDQWIRDTLAATLADRDNHAAE
jgi:hypothetical protein